MGKTRSTGHGSKYERLKDAVIALLLTGLSKKEVAKQVGVGERTVRRWCERPDFIADYEEARRRRFDGPIHAISVAATKAARVLEDAIDYGPDALRAAKYALDSAQKFAAVERKAGRERSATECVVQAGEEERRTKESRPARAKGGVEEEESHVKAGTFRSRILSLPGISRLVKRGGKPAGEQERKTKTSQPAGKKQRGSHDKETRPHSQVAVLSAQDMVSQEDRGRDLAEEEGKGARNSGGADERPGSQAEETTVPDDVVSGQLKEEGIAVEEDREGEQLMEAEQAVGDPEVAEEKEEVKGPRSQAQQTRLPDNTVPPPQTQEEEQAAEEDRDDLPRKAERKEENPGVAEEKRGVEGQSRAKEVPPTKTVSATSFLKKRIAQLEQDIAARKEFLEGIHRDRERREALEARLGKDIVDHYRRELSLQMETLASLKERLAREEGMKGVHCGHPRPEGQAATDIEENRVASQMTADDRR